MIRQDAAVSLVDDPRWRAMVERYAFDPVSFMRDAWGYHASFDLAMQVQNRHRVRSIDTDEPDELMVMLALHHVLCFYNSNVYVTGPKVEVVRVRFWRLLGDAMARLRQGDHAWLAEAVVVRNDRMFVIDCRHSWFMAMRTASRLRPENLAGTNNRYLMWIVLDAHYVDPVCFRVMEGALCYDTNHLIMSTPQRLRRAGQVAANG